MPNASRPFEVLDTCVTEQPPELEAGAAAGVVDAAPAVPPLGAAVLPAELTVSCERSPRCPAAPVWPLVVVPEVEPLLPAVAVVVLELPAVAPPLPASLDATAPPAPPAALVLPDAPALAELPAVDAEDPAVAPEPAVLLPSAGRIFSFAQW
jgi:hypothetical protein